MNQEVERKNGTAKKTARWNPNILIQNLQKNLNNLSEKAGHSKMQRYGLMAVFGLVGIVLIALTLGVVVLFGLGASGSVSNDEVKSIRKQAVDYQEWRKQSDALIAGNLPEGKVEEPQSFGWWKKHTMLPSEKAVKAALERRLPKGVKLVEFKPVWCEEDEGELNIKYQVTLRLKEDICAVPVTKLKLGDKKYEAYKGLADYILASEDLPAGWTYVPENKTDLYGKGLEEKFVWEIKQAKIEDGKWRIKDAGVIPFQRSGELELKYLDTTKANSVLMRFENEIEGMDAVRQDAMDRFFNHLDEISKKVEEFKNSRMAQVGEKPVRGKVKFGGSGSGEPTKTAMRVGGGAATGAAVGAIADGGEGAGWGALAGAGAGLIYDVFSKSSDKNKAQSAQDRAYAQAMSAWRAEVRAAEKEVEDYRKNLMEEYSAGLKEQAQARLEELKGKK